MAWHLLKVYQRSSSGVAMIALHQRGEGIQKRFWAIQRIYVKLGFVFVSLVVRVKHHGRNTLAVPF
jgi:hypothetical protein